MVLDAALLNTQQYKVRINSKVEQSREWSNALPYTLDPFLILLSVKQGGIKYYFLSFWYDSNWD